MENEVSTDSLGESLDVRTGSWDDKMGSVIVSVVAVMDSVADYLQEQ